MSQTITKAIIPAAGLGTRFLPMTKSSPKEMLPIVDKPVIQFVVEEAAECGITDVLIVTGRGKRAIENHFDYAPGLENHLVKQGKQEQARLVHSIGEQVNIYFVRQKEQLGLGDAVRLGRSFVGDDAFALLLGDTIIDPAPDSGVHGLRELMNVYDQHQRSVVAVRHVPSDWIARYGIVDGQAIPDPDRELYTLRQLVEKPPAEKAPSDLAIAGRYLFTPAIFDCLENLEPGAGGELQLTDAMNQLAQREAVQALAWRATRYDIGNKADYVRCFLDFARRHPDTAEATAAYLAQHRD